MAVPVPPVLSAALSISIHVGDDTRPLKNQQNILLGPGSIQLRCHAELGNHLIQL